MLAILRDERLVQADVFEFIADIERFPPAAHPGFAVGMTVHPGF
jgi:hypothetical protein